MTDLIPGKRYAVTLHGTADDDGDLKVDGGGYHLYRGAMLDDVVSIEQLPDVMPQWQVGDVIAWDEADEADGPKMRHVAMRIYTYSGMPYWRDAAAHPELGTLVEIRDKQVAELWDAGRLELVARDGRPWPKDGAR